MHHRLQLDDLSSSPNTIYEDIWIQIKNKAANRKNTMMWDIYHHPGLTINDFINNLDGTLTYLPRNNLNYHIVGDFNIDILKRNKNVYISAFVDFVLSHNNIMPIYKPTRYPIADQVGLPSLLDHYYTNDISNACTWDVIARDVSDHQLVFATIKHTAKRFKSFSRN